MRYKPEANRDVLKTEASLEDQQEAAFVPGRICGIRHRHARSLAKTFADRLEMTQVLPFCGEQCCKMTSTQPVYCLEPVGTLVLGQSATISLTLSFSAFKRFFTTRCCKEHV